MRVAISWTWLSVWSKNRSFITVIKCYCELVAPELCAFFRLIIKNFTLFFFFRLLPGVSTTSWPPVAFHSTSRRNARRTRSSWKVWRTCCWRIVRASPNACPSARSPRSRVTSSQSRRPCGPRRTFRSSTSALRRWPARTSTRRAAMPVAYRRRPSTLRTASTRTPAFRPSCTIRRCRTASRIPSDEPPAGPPPSASSSNASPPRSSHRRRKISEHPRVSGFCFCLLFFFSLLF